MSAAAKGLFMTSSFASLLFSSILSSSAIIYGVHAHRCRRAKNLLCVLSLISMLLSFVY
jgi:hypothetical protein